MVTQFSKTLFKHMLMNVTVIVHLNDIVIITTIE